MKELLVDPTVVLALGRVSTGGFHEYDVLEDTAATDVVTAGTLDEALDHLESRGDVGCLIVSETGDWAVSDGPARVREVSAELPILVHGPELDAREVGELGRWSDCRYLPEETAPETVLAAIDDALSAFERRRDARADSRLFQTLLAGTDRSLFAKDDGGRYVRSSRLSDANDRPDVIGKTDREVFGTRHPSAAEEAYRDDLEVVETGEPIVRKRERFGSEFWSETTKLPVTDDEGSPEGLVGMAIDVTAEVENGHLLEEQRRRFDQFADYVSHDLRTPLQIAYGAAEQLREGDDDTLDTLDTALKRIEETIDDLRRLTETDISTAVSDLTGESDPTVASTELATLVREIWAITAPKSTSLELELPDSTLVIAEPEALRPLLENLVKNAVQHAGSAVTIEVGLVGDRGFYVADDGPGIPEADRDRVLEQGYTTDSAGTGTGLAIVEETVLREDWSLSITDSDDGGARFEITECPVVVPVTVTAGDPVDLVTSADVGDPAFAGSADYDDEADRWHVVGGGEDVWGDVEEFHSVAATADTAVRIQGRVDDLAAVDEYSKAGVMVRDDDSPGVPFGYVGATGGHGSEVIWRESPDDLASSTQFEEPPGAYPWYRIDCVDETVTCSLSAHGEAWHPVDQRQVALESPVTVGLAVCSHSETESATAEFTDVSAWRLRTG